MLKDQNNKKWNEIAGSILKFFIPVIVSVGLCWVLFHNDNIGPMIDVIKTKCDFKWIGFMLLASFFSYLFRSFRWQLQLNEAGIYPTFRQILYSIFGTYAVNLVFPRLGEVWRSGYIAHRANAPFANVFGSMLADRFADLITVVLILMLTILVGHDAISAFIDTYPEGYRKLTGLAESPLTWGAIAALATGTVIFFRYKTNNAVAQKIKSFGTSMWNGFVAIVHIPQRGKWLFWTAMLWGCYFFQMFLAFEAFPFTREIIADDGIVPVLVCFTLGSIAMGIPSNGGIGPYQLALIFGLSLYAPEGLDAGGAKSFDIDSKAFANLVLTMSTCLSILLGLWTFISIALSKKREPEAKK